MKYEKVLIRILKIIIFTAAIAIVTKLTLEFGTITKTSTAAFSFLIIVLLSAFFGDLLIAIITSVVAALSFDYFYLPPAGTLNIAEFSDWISLAAFLLTSLIISRLTASASDNKIKVNILNQTLVQIKEFEEKILSIPQDNLTLSEIAREALNVFSLEYCSIHVYSGGKWRHFTGAASSDIPLEVENRMKYLADHPSDLLEIADENVLGVTYAQINKGESTLALLAVKGKTLPAGAIGTIAYMIGARIKSNIDNIVS